MESREIALLAVFDDDLPANWPLWGKRLKDYVSKVENLNPTMPETMRQFDQYRFRLLLDTPAELLSRKDTELLRIVGAIVDPAQYGPMAEKADAIKKRFSTLCSKILKASVNRDRDEVLVCKIGFHLIFAANEDTPDDAFSWWMGELLNIVGSTLPDYIPYMGAPKIVPNEQIFSYNLEHHLRDIALLRMRTAKTHRGWQGVV